MLISQQFSYRYKHHKSVGGGTTLADQHHRSVGEGAHPC